MKILKHNYMYSVCMCMLGKFHLTVKIKLDHMNYDSSLIKS